MSVPPHLCRTGTFAMILAAVLATGAQAEVTLTPAQKTCLAETNAALAEARRAQYIGQHGPAAAAAPDQKPLLDAVLAMDLAMGEVQRLQIAYLIENHPSDTAYDPAVVPVSALQGVVTEPMLVALEKDPAYAKALETLADATYAADKLGGRERAAYVTTKSPMLPEQQTAALEAGNAYYVLAEKVCGR